MSRNYSLRFYNSQLPAKPWNEDAPPGQTNPALACTPSLSPPLPLHCVPLGYALIWHAVHVERKLFRKALFMLRHKFNANKEAQAAAPRSRPHPRSPSHFPTPCGPQKAAPRCAREIYLTAAASLSPFLIFDAALDEMAAAVAVAVADTPWAWAGCLCVWQLGAGIKLNFNF